MLICVLSVLVLNSSKKFNKSPNSLRLLQKNYSLFFFVILIEYLISVFSFEIVAEENIVTIKCSWSCLLSTNLVFDILECLCFHLWWCY